ncbi:serine/threonine-protein phosphatase 6 regulatory ankyrin repeat subunit A-like isoform X2 [Corticium candelabrum]|nr:serine/threonine-protein phosphatase 6 regulatory ankyrin repeat subunit A-like isoform X2 [Corticium candelabrum]
MYSASSVRSRSDGTHTALARASSRGDVTLIHHLLSNGANVNGCNHRSKSTALHYAASIGHLASCKVLVEYGANVNAFDAEMNTPLHLAAQSGNVQLVHYLLCQRADKSVETSYGLTALQMAEAGGHTDCAGLLRPALPSSFFPPIATYQGVRTGCGESLENISCHVHEHLKRVKSCEKVARWLEDLALHGMLKPQPPPRSHRLDRRQRGNTDRRKMPLLSMSTMTLDGSILMARSKHPRTDATLCYSYKRPKLRLTQSAPVQCT